MESTGGHHDSVSVAKNQEMSDEQKISMQKALNNPLVLEIILKTLDFPSLKICRQVGPSWKFFADSILLRHDSCKLCLTKTSDLGKLNLILENSTHFPCFTVSLKDRRVESEDVRSFFDLVGHQIKSLTLSNYAPIQAGNHIQRNMSQVISKDYFRQILQELTPTLENLHVTGYDPYEWADGEVPALPLLKHFSWAPSCRPTASKILEGASSPFLKISQQKRKLNDEDVDTLDKFQKSFCLTQLHLSGFANHQMTLSKLAAMDPQFVTIDLGHRPFLESTDEEVRRVLEIILNSSRHSLENFLLAHDDAVAGLRFPRLENLKMLKFTKQIHNNTFPAVRFNLNDTFPNLKILDCTGLNCRAWLEWGRLFPQTEQQRHGEFSTVKKLIMGSTSSANWMSQMTFLCPNFKVVEVPCRHLSNSRTMEFDHGILSRIIQVWTHLKEIDVTIPESFEGRKYWMDSDFTGDTRFACDKLRESKTFLINHEEEEERGKAETKSVPFFVQNFTELKILRVRLMGRPKIPFSQLASWKVFRHMPELKVVVHFDHDKYPDEIHTIYEELTPFVNIRHEKYRFEEDDD